MDMPGKMLGLFIDPCIAKKGHSGFHRLNEITCVFQRVQVLRRVRYWQLLELFQ